MGKTILVAEDNLDDVFVLRRAFAKAELPHQLRFVPNGREVIDYLQGKPPYNNRTTFPIPAALLLDLNMPLKNGLEVLQWVRSQPKFKELPAAILAGQLGERHRAQARELGATAFYIKTVDSAAMATMFKELAELL
jgi:CheY-like chemotaxis protein